MSGTHKTLKGACNIILPCVVKFKKGVLAMHSIYRSYPGPRMELGSWICCRETVTSTCVSFITACSVHQWIEDELLYLDIYQALV